MKKRKQSRIDLMNFYTSIIHEFGLEARALFEKVIETLTSKF